MDTCNKTDDQTSLITLVEKLREKTTSSEDRLKDKSDVEAMNLLDKRLSRLEDLLHAIRQALKETDWSNILQGDANELYG